MNKEFLKYTFTCLSFLTSSIYAQQEDFNIKPTANFNSTQEENLKNKGFFRISIGIFFLLKAAQNRLLTFQNY